MKTLTLVLAAVKRQSPRPSWWNVAMYCKSYYPALSSASLSTFYRTIRKAISEELLINDRLFNDEDKQLNIVTLTDHGDHRLNQELEAEDVGVGDILVPTMHANRFLDYVALLEDVRPDLIKKALKRRISSISSVLECGLSGTKSVTMSAMRRSLLLQYRVEVTMLEAERVRLEESHG